MWAAIAKLAAPILGGLAGSSAQNRGAKEDRQLSRDQLALQGRQLYEDSLVNRAKLEAEQRAQAQRDAYRADAVQGFSPLSVRGPDGQPINLAIGQGARDTAALTERQALLRLMEGGPTGMQYATTQMTRPQPFTPTAAPTMKWWERLLNIAAPAAGLYGAYSDARGGQGMGYSTMDRSGF